MANKEKINLMIKQLRKERGLDQDAMAERLGVSRSTICMWEAGQRKPDRRSVEKICNYFNIDMNYLYGLSEIKNTYSQDKVIQIPLYKQGEMYDYMIIPSTLLNSERKYMGIIEIDDSYDGIKEGEIAVFDKISNKLVLILKRADNISWPMFIHGCVSLIK